MTARNYCFKWIISCTFYTLNKRANLHHIPTCRGTRETPPVRDRRDSALLRSSRFPAKTKQRTLINCTCKWNKWTKIVSHEKSKNTSKESSPSHRYFVRSQPSRGRGCCGTYNHTHRCISFLCSRIESINIATGDIKKITRITFRAFLLHKNFQTMLANRSPWNSRSWSRHRRRLRNQCDRYLESFPL